MLQLIQRSLLICIVSLFASVRARGENFSYAFSRWAFDFAAASYADDPWPCLRKHNASLVLQVEVPCDAIHDKCWAIVANSPDFIIIAFQGTGSKSQLIAELIETITSAKHNIKGIGSVERYFYVALVSIAEPLAKKVNKLRETFPEKDVLFTGHSLGGALASLAAAIYVYEYPINPSQVHLITFGQPRVGNFEYAMSVDKLLPNSWRLVHKQDLVAHIPYCVGLRECEDFYNHSPYHHGVEVWFPDAMNATDMYRICTGVPVDEDSTCSDSHYLFYIEDHLYYFEEHVSDYGLAGCTSTPDTRRPLIDREDRADPLEMSADEKKVADAAFRRMLRDLRAGMRHRYYDYKVQYNNTRPK